MIRVSQEVGERIHLPIRDKEELDGAADALKMAPGSRVPSRHRFSRHPCQTENMIKRPGQGFYRHVRPFPDTARGLDQPVNQEAAEPVENRRAVAVAPVVKAYDNP